MGVRGLLRDVMEMDAAYAAAIYDAAVAAGRPPKVAVAQELKLPPSTASRRIRLARELGLLPPANGTRVAANPVVGPHQPATAEVNRGRPGALKVRVCAACITRWPCPAEREAQEARTIP